MSFTSLAVDQIDIEGALNQLLASHHFRRKHNSKVLLKYLLKATLAGGAERLTGDQIGRECLEGRTELQLATEKRRLRQHLNDFYELEGAAERVRFTINPHSYVVEIRSIEPTDNR